METHWIVLFVCVIPFWFLQNVIHELSHGLAMYLGWKWKFKIWPFPSNRLGRFTFAHVKYERTNESKDLSDLGRGFVSIAPQLVNCVLITLTLVALLCWVSSAIVWSAILVLFMWTNFIDLSANLSTLLRSSGNTDIWKFKRYQNIPLNLLRYSCTGIVVWYAWLVIITTWVKLFTF